MSATDAVSRLLVLVPWLLERPGAHVDEAAAAVGAHRSEVLADLAMLNFCGLPGRLGGDLFECDVVGDRILLALAPAFDRPLRPTPDDALRLVLSLDHVAAVLGDELPGLDDALDAVRRAAGVPAGVRVLPEPATAHLGPLRDAVTNGTSVELEYRGRADADAKLRRIDPWELLLHRGIWYLHAHDHDAGDHRTFRLDRVEGVRSLDAAVTVPRPDGALPTPRYVPGPDDLEVVLTVGPRGHWVLDLLAADEVEHADDGTATVRLSTDAPRWLVQLVLAGRGNVVVREPAELRDAVVEAARAGLAAHEEWPPQRA